MIVLSLFDGMSCGQIALERAGISVEKYYASEIDPYAIKITQKNYPNTIQLGNVENWREWELPKIDLLIGGSPCQGFSLAGKQLNFNDPRSKLFFEFADVLKAVKPTYFLLENVKMKKESQDIISEYLGVEPIEINSALVSAQNRVRLYWTNIPNISIPEDKGIFLKDIIENDVVEYSRKTGAGKKLYKSKPLLASDWRGLNRNQKQNAVVIGGAMRGRYDENGKVVQQLELRKDEKSNALTTVEKDTLVVNKCIQVGEAELNGYDCLKRVYSVEGKSPTLTAMGGGNTEPKIALDEIHWRALIPLEMERLQTVPENYTEGVSTTQRKRMLGNAWTVDIISHLFKPIC